LHQALQVMFFRVTPSTGTTFPASILGVDDSTHATIAVWLWTGSTQSM